MSSNPSLIAVAVVEHRGQFLVGVRPPGVPLAGYSEFPGGKVEAGERPADAAARECLEETGLAVEVVGEFPDRIQQYAHGRLRLRFFQCRVHNGQPAPRAPFRWVARDQLAALRFPAGNDRLLAMLQRSPQDSE